MTEPVRISVGACRCPGAPHAEDAVFLEPTLTNPMGAAAWSAIRSAATASDAEGGVAGVYLRLGIRNWTFVDEAGNPEPITPDNIERLLPFAHGGSELVEQANKLYVDDLMAPLLRQRAKSATSSDAGPTASSTLPSPDSGDAPPTP